MKEEGIEDGDCVDDLEACFKGVLNEKEN